MSKKTTSEMLFEQFCESNSLLYERVPEGNDPSPDYCVKLEAGHVYFEVKEIERDDAFLSESSTRTVGDHIRAKINEARNQVRAASAAGSPTVLLVYNNLDPLQRFGTEEHDFLAAMYGEPTVLLSVESGEIVDSFHGRNKSFRKGKNESFSAIGLLRKVPSGAVTAHIYENVPAGVQLRYESLPVCFTFNRVEFEDDQAA